MSVLGSVILMVSGASIHLPFGMLPRYKADITTIARTEGHRTGRQWRAVTRRGVLPGPPPPSLKFSRFGSDGLGTNVTLHYHVVSPQS